MIQENKIKLCPDDTHPQVFKEYQKKIMSKSGAQRLQMACSMLATAKALMKADLLSRFPNLTAIEIRNEIFKRLYANDFSPEEIDQIIRKLPQS